MLIIYFAVTAGVCGARREHVIRPVNTYFVLGQAQPLHFNCTITGLVYPDGLEWHKTNVSLNAPYYVTLTIRNIVVPNQVGRYEVVNDNKTLAVLNAGYSDAGQYECTTVAISSSSPRAYAEAVILGKTSTHSFLRFIFAFAYCSSCSCFFSAFSYSFFPGVST